MGDFNLDLLNHEYHTTTQEFLDALFSYMIIPLITKPTRVTAHSATLIDNIFTNCFSQNILSGNILNDSSDHFPIFAFFNNDLCPPTVELKSFTHDFSEANILNFQSCLSVVDWTDVVIGEDPNTAFDAFLSEYNRHFDNCFPVIVKRNMFNKPKTPWISEGILVSVKKNNRLYKKFMKHPTPIREVQYKAYKNKLNNLIRIAKRMYYDDKFERSKNDLKATWKLINEVINKKNCKRPLLTSFNLNSRTISDPAEIANGFCDYFTNVGPTLAGRIQPTNVAFDRFLGPANDQTIFLNPTSITELKEICSSFNARKAPVITFLCTSSKILLTLSAHH